MNETVKIRIHGETLGTTSELVSFLHALERVYNYFLVFDKLWLQLIQNVNMESEKQIRSAMKKLKFINKYQIRKLVLPEERLTLSSIQISSPGIWEGLAKLSPIIAINTCLNDAQKRKHKEDLHGPKVQLEHFKVIGGYYELLTKIGLPEEQIRQNLENYLKISGLLDKHMETGRITGIEIMGSADEDVNQD